VRKHPHAQSPSPRGEAGIPDLSAQHQLGEAGIPDLSAQHQFYFDAPSVPTQLDSASSSYPSAIVVAFAIVLDVDAFIVPPRN
jgi:hypothetical protein